MQHEVRILSIKHATHDVLHIVTEKPDNYKFHPGQATDVSVYKKGWEDKKSPFTFTCLPENDYVEFFIKTYPSHDGVTNQLLQLKIGDELFLYDVFGAIAYKGEGIFIAGGAGITPFISILRNLEKDNKIGNNKLIFANKTKSDIILENDFKTLLNEKFINIISDEKVEGYAHGYITEDFLKENMSDELKYFYLCGPPPMMDAVEKQLNNLHIDKDFIIKEAF